MSKIIRDELICELLKLAERIERNPDKVSWIMHAVKALQDGRRDIDAALELDLYAKIDAEAGHHIEADLLSSAARVLMVRLTALPPLPPPRRVQTRPRSR